MSGRVLSVCEPAPSEGVFVDAPEKIPSTAAMSKPASQPMSGAPIAPRITIVAASRFSFTPCCRSAAKKPGAELQADREDEQHQPELLHEIERVLIDRIAEMSDDNPGEKHAGGAQADAAEFQTAQRHSEHTDKGERADRVRDGLRLVQLEEPVHASSYGRRGFHLGARTCGVGLEILVEQRRRAFSRQHRTQICRPSFRAGAEFPQARRGIQ